MENKIDFTGLSSFLLQRIRDIVPSWLPGGKMVGHEWTCGDLRGGQGGSCKVNINTGKWGDFASNDAGGDLISLYAAIQGIKQGEAAKQLAQEYNYQPNIQTDNNVQRETNEPQATKPPNPCPAPRFGHPKYGEPVKTWQYNDAAGELLFYIARYKTPEGKEFMPITWVPNRWVFKAWPAPRPLYGLDRLSKDPKKPVLIVEGEKAADAAQAIASAYVVVTWPGGSKAVKKIDWSPIYGRSVLIWPDNDISGFDAAADIIEILKPHCQTIKTIKIPTGSLPEGWDAADAVDDKWDGKRFIEWAKPLAVTVNITHNVTNNTLNVSQTTVNFSAPEEDHAVPSESMYAVWDRLGLALSQSGYPINNEDNVARIFEGTPILGERLWFDDFYNSVFIETKNGGQELKDLDIFKLTMHLQRNYGMSRISDATVRRALLILADRVHKNEPLDWMESLKWDGKPRIEAFCVTHLGAKSTPYVLAASKNFWISMASRIYNPGCIMRTMIILKSKQWAGKSTAFAIIGGKWYAEALESIQSNNFLQSLHGKMLIEFADMSGMDRADVNRIKQVISCRMDRFRAPYDRVPNDHPRRCVLVSTTNEGNFLRDDTGGSRFWPIETGVIQHDKITADRDQLFAEAVHYFKAGAAWHIMPMEETEAIQESYRQTDEWETIIEEWLNKPGLFNNETTVARVAFDCLKIPVDKLDKSTQIRIARNLTTVGWEKHQKREGDKVVKVWRPKVNPVSDDHETIIFD